MNKYLLLFSIIIISGCSDTITNPENKQPNFLSFIDIGKPYKQYINRYDQTNVIGLIEIETSVYDGYSSNGNPYIGSSTDAYAHFVNPANTTEDMSIGNIIINGNILKPFEKGYYRWNILDSALIVHFGNNDFNRIQTELSYPLVINDSMQFSDAIQITGITKGQNLSRSKPITINWTGISSDFVDLQLMMSEPWNDTLGSYVGYMSPYDNTGSVTIPANQLSKVGNRKATISVTKYEPKFITLSNGKRVCILGTSKHEIAVNLVD